MNQTNKQDKNRIWKNQGLIIFIKFGLVGVSNTIVNYIIYAVTFYFSKNYVLANVAAWLLSVLHAYIWQNIFVFKADRNKEKRVWWHVLLKTYTAYAFTGLFLNNVLSWLWISVIDISRYCGGIIELLAGWGLSMTPYEFSGYACPILNMIFAIPINFFINKLWAYKQK